MLIVQERESGALQYFFSRTFLCVHFRNSRARNQPQRWEIPVLPASYINLCVATYKVIHCLTTLMVILN